MGSPQGDGWVWEVTVDGDVFTSQGYRNCIDVEVTCWFSVFSGTSTRQIATSPTLEFSGPADQRPELVSIEVADIPGSYTLRGDGLAIASLEVCSLGPAQPNPRGVELPLWGEPVGVQPWINCDRVVGAEYLGDEPQGQTWQLLHTRGFYGYAGWSDCLRSACYVRVEYVDDRVVDQVMPIDERLASTPIPAITVRSPAPHRAGDSIEIEISGLHPEVRVDIGLCPTTIERGCGYVDTARDLTNGVHEYTIPSTACGACVLALSVADTGIRPLAVTPLNLGS